MFSICRTSTGPSLSVAILLLSSIVNLRCSSDAGHDANAADRIESDGELFSYPRAGWRLLQEETLDDIVVWSAHILIRHSDADAKVPFTRYDWHAAEPVPPRTRAQAVALAEHVAERAAAHPEDFAALAAEYSEDAATRSLGGELGGLRAADMAAEPEVLDALTALRAGEVSRAVETSHGVHVLLRKSPAAAESMAGLRIVIGHVDGDWRGRNRPSRTRAEAYELARQLYERLRAEPAGRAALARQYSDWHAASGGNELGASALAGPSGLGRQLAVLRKLEVGDVAAPFEGPLGVEILVRTESPPPDSPSWGPRPREAQTELPAVVRPELGQLLARIPPRVVVQELDAVLEGVSLEAAPNPDQLQLLAEVRAHGEPIQASTLAGPPRAAFADGLAAYLAADTTGQLRFLLEERLISRLLNARVIRYRRELTR